MSSPGVLYAAACKICGVLVTLLEAPLHYEEHLQAGQVIGTSCSACPHTCPPHCAWVGLTHWHDEGVHLAETGELLP